MRILCSSPNLCILLSLVVAFTVCVNGNPEAKLLYEELLVDYNRLIRPVENVSDTMVVNLTIRLSQLMDVNMRMSMMVTNLWVQQNWIDFNLQWNPAEFGGVEELYVPAEIIWLPDIVLYNNWDGNYEVTLMTKATVRYTGEIAWTPPAIYKSSCEINVEWFPFDQQSCALKFGSWTWNGGQVDLRHVDQKNGSNYVRLGVDLRAFYPSVEWDIVDAPARRNQEYHPCCDEPIVDILFNLTMRRKTLFYTVNLIIPCVGISFLTVLVFYLPSASGEKIALCMSILLALTVFLLLLGEIIPPTSLAVPLLGKYLLFTMVIVTMSISATVGVLNVHFRSPSTYKMPKWVRVVFIETMPWILRVQRPKKRYSYEQQQPECHLRPEHRFQDRFYDDDDDYDDDWSPGTESSFDYSRHTHTAQRRRPRYNHSAKTLEAFANVEFIAQHIRDADKENEICEDWKYVALVLDRMFLYVFLFGGLAGLAFILALAPSLYDYRPALHVPEIEYPTVTRNNY